MRKATLTIMSLLVATALPVLALAGTAMDDTTSNAQYVYSESTSSDGAAVVNYSEAASDKDENLVELFIGEADESALYIGMDTIFDKVKIDLTGSVEYQDSADLNWEYFNGSTWSTLDVEGVNFNDFINIDTEIITFNIPSNWSKADFEFADNTTVAEEGYWIRVSSDEVVESGSLDQISVVAYMLEVILENADGERIINLSEENFSVSGATDNELYGVYTTGNGVYKLAVNTEASITDYRLLVTVPGYNQLATDVSMDGLNSVSVNEIEVTNTLEIDEDCQPEYLDLESHWGMSAVRALYCRQVFQISNSNFRPNTRVSRAEFLKMALISAGIDTDLYKYKANPYDDVDRYDDWYGKYAIAAYDLDVIDKDDNFNPDYSLNRAEAVVILLRLAQVEVGETSTDFTDVNDSDWFAAYVRAAADMEVVEGYTDGTFQGYRYLSRAEAAVMVDNIFNAAYLEQ